MNAAIWFSCSIPVFIAGAVLIGYYWDLWDGYVNPPGIAMVFLLLLACLFGPITLGIGILALIVWIPVTIGKRIRKWKDG